MVPSFKVRLTTDGAELLRRLVAAEERCAAAERARMTDEAERRAAHTCERLLEELDQVGVDDRLVIIYSDFEKPDTFTAMELAVLGRLLGVSFKRTKFVKRTDEEHIRLDSPAYVFSMTRRELVTLLKTSSPS